MATQQGTPVVFIHGLWLHASSWQPWLELFEQAGYAPIAPEWLPRAFCYLTQKLAAAPERRHDYAATSETGLASRSRSRGEGTTTMTTAEAPSGAMTAMRTGTHTAITLHNSSSLRMPS